MSRRTINPAGAANCNACIRPGANPQRLLRPLRGRQSLLQHLSSLGALRDSSLGALRDSSLATLRDLGLMAFQAFGLRTCDVQRSRTSATVFRHSQHKSLQWKDTCRGA